MRRSEYIKYNINGRKFAELWLRKYYPNRKKTKVVDWFYEVDSLAVYYNRKIDGYDSNHFEYSYIVDFMRAAGKVIEPEIAK